MLFISAGVEYAKKILEGQTNGTLDDAVLRSTIQECAEEFYPGIQMTVENYEENGKLAMANHYLVMSDFVTF